MTTHRMWQHTDDCGCHGKQAVFEHLPSDVAAVVVALVAQLTADDLVRVKPPAVRRPKTTAAGDAWMAAYKAQFGQKV